MNYRAMNKPPRTAAAGSSSRRWRSRHYRDSAADDWNETAGADIDHSITVYESDAEPVRTGLVDACGTPIYRFPERRPIGFVLRQK